MADEDPEALPKTSKSADWLNKADIKRAQIMSESGKRGFMGRQILKPSSQVFKAMSDKEVMLRNKGMALKRAESKQMSK